MKQSMHSRKQSTRSRKLLLVALAALPLVASASTAGMFNTDALLSEGSLAGFFDWPRFSLLAAGVIALVRARASATTNAIDDINVANKSGNTF